MGANWIAKLKQLQTKAAKKAHRVAEALKNQWVVVAAAIWIQCCSGSSYNFGIYSESIKLALNYDQSALNTLATFKDLGANVGVISGIIFDYSSPGGVLALGAVQSCLGHAMLWLSVTGWIPSQNLWQTCICMFFAANGQTYFNTACVVTCVQHFPCHRGIAIGLLKGFLGLSGALLTQLFHAMYPDDDGHSFLILVSWLPSLMAITLIPVFRRAKHEQIESSPSVRRRESSNFFVLSAMALVLAAYLMVVIVLESVISFTQAAYICICAGSVAFLLLPLFVAFRSKSITPNSKSLLPTAAPWLSISSVKEPLLASSKERYPEEEYPCVEEGQQHQDQKACSADIDLSLAKINDSLFPPGGESQEERFTNKAEAQKLKRSRNPIFQAVISIIPFWKQDKGREGSCQTNSSENGFVVSHPTLESGTSNVSDDALAAPKNLSAVKMPPRRGEDHTFVEGFSTIDYWLMFMGVMCGQGCGLTAIDNFGQVGTSLGYSSSSVGTFISLISVWNFLGRFGFGALSECGLHRFKIGRARYLVFTQIAMCLAHVCIAFDIPGCLYAGSIVIGLSYGAQWSLVPSLASELFGLARFATLYNSITIASPIGVYLLSVQAAGRLYDMEASSQAATSHHQWGLNFSRISFHHLLLGPVASEDGAAEQGGCSGAHCYRLAFILLACVSLLGAMFYMILAERTASFYAHDISEKLSHPSNADEKPIGSTGSEGTRSSKSEARHS